MSLIQQVRACDLSKKMHNRKKISLLLFELIFTYCFCCHPVHNKGRIRMSQVAFDSTEANSWCNIPLLPHLNHISKDCIWDKTSAASLQAFAPKRDTDEILPLPVLRRQVHSLPRRKFSGRGITLQRGPGHRVWIQNFLMIAVISQKKIFWPGVRHCRACNQFSS